MNDYSEAGFNSYDKCKDYVLIFIVTESQPTTMRKEDEIDIEAAQGARIFQLVHFNEHVHEEDKDDYGYAVTEAVMPVQEAPIDYHVQRAKLPDNVDEYRKCPDAR